MKQFIIVPAIEDSHHVIDIQLIETISRKEGKLNKSEIRLIGSERELYSTSAPLEIFNELKKIMKSNEIV